MSTIEAGLAGFDAQRHTILIVDDEPANLAVVAEYLASYGFQIKVAQTGEAGLELARLTQPDLILLDVRLPGIDGLQVCCRLKADEKMREIPVIFMTIMAKTEDKVKGFEVGGVDYITKPFQHEEILARVTTHLRLRELTRDLQDRTAQLEATNKELEAFAYSVSHDLRAPLRHIDGFLELLQKRPAVTLDEQSQHYVTTIADAAKRMGLLIDDLLSFSRMGRHEFSWQPVNLNDLIQEIRRDFEPETSDRNIHWRIADLPVVTGDRAMLRVVLVNLISNALKYTQSRPQADIEIGFTREANETILFVRDNGVGFNMQYVVRLFDVFQRLHRADEFEGTGIGLANVRRIINRHGGKTWAEGEVDHGATFYFSLPDKGRCQTVSSTPDRINPDATGCDDGLDGNWRQERRYVRRNVKSSPASWPGTIRCRPGMSASF